jgi:hypothetical protein
MSLMFDSQTDFEEQKDHADSRQDADGFIRAQVIQTVETEERQVSEDHSENQFAQPRRLTKEFQGCPTQLGRQENNHQRYQHYGNQVCVLFSGPGPEPNDSEKGADSAAETAEEGSSERPDSELSGPVL